MITSHRLLRSALIAVALLATAPVHADPASDLASFSAFKGVDLEKLAGGSPMVVRGPAMSFPRGLAVESLYVIRKPLAKTAEFHLQWTPVKHPELKVYMHTDLHGAPAVADFQKIASAPSTAPIKEFAAATQKLATGNSELQLSSAEGKAFASTGSGPSGGALSGQVSAFWSNVLFQRTGDFLSGGLGKLPPYETKGEAVRPSDEASRLLKDAARVRAHFSSLIDATPLGGGRGSLPPAPYWELLDVEGQGTVNLGALYYRAGADTWQGVDFQYYASGQYYAFVSFFQMWAVKIGGQDATLVWRGDLISAPELARLHGMERMGSSTAMMRETQRFVDCFVKDAAKAP